MAPTEVPTPTYWREIAAEGDSERLAEEAHEFLRSIETNVPKEMRPGFESLESVLVGLVRQAPAEQIREAGRLITA